MKHTRDVKDLRKEDVLLAGAKAASLGSLTQAGLLVPSGFVVLASAFEEMVADKQAEIQGILDQVRLDEPDSLASASQRIRRVILSKPLPGPLAEEIVARFKSLNAPRVAVRSSATAEDSLSAAWAGQTQDTRSASAARSTSST